MEQRLRQEIVLGIGGVRALRALGYEGFVLHLNEGHAAFALLERVRRRVENGFSFEMAAEDVRRAAVFTTHTPVPAGHDRFPFYLIEKYFRGYWPSLKLDRDTFLRLGAHPDDPPQGYNMTALALRLCAHRNAVSRRHAEVSHRMWKGLWAGLEADGRATVDSVTNGVHVPTWVDPKIALLLDKYLGPGWVDQHDDPALWERVDDISAEELWRIHYWLKIKLIDAVRERLGALLDPAVLTIGFARRFATYKRADLIFEDVARIKTLLKSRWRPVQIIFAGKAHPADEPGKRILQRVFNLCRDPDMGGRIAFVEDYGEQIAQYLLHGVDLWLNTPMPPMEACGTSGMKAALNGVPQLSIMDGWWLEGYHGKNGWAVAHREEAGNPDRADADALFRILEEEIIPLYYKCSGSTLPEAWVAVMKSAMKVAGGKFSARRMVREYCTHFYSKAMAGLDRTPTETQ